jgi:benzodiazapine receptor
MSHIRDTSGRVAATSLAKSMAVAFLPAVVGAPTVAREPYELLSKPRWAPRPWIFGPVWTALYASLGLASWMVDRRDPASTEPKRLYRAQLGLNALWTPLFFGARRRGAALVDIVAMWVSAALMIRAFYRVRRAAGLLLLPYLGWITFATLLNAVIWHRNRGR